MATFTATVETGAPPEAVWLRLTDWPRHGHVVPLTTVRVTDARPEGLGTRFTARTGLGPIGFDDPMEVVEWVPPARGAVGRCTVRKHGRVILGESQLEVRGRPDGGSTAVWIERVQVAPVSVTRPFDRLVTLGGRLAFTRALRLLLTDLEPAAPR